MTWDFSRYDSLWQAIASRNLPPGPQPADCGWTAQGVATHLMARGIVYNGPCGSGSKIGTGAQVGTLVSGAVANVVPGASIISSILGIFGQHHAQAVAQEQGVVCEVANAANQAIPQLDAAVASGQITAQQGIDTMGQLVAQLKQTLASISGQGKSGHPCNAGCCYQYVLDTHLDFAKTFYKDISPMQSIPNPSTPNYTAPASTLDAVLQNVFPSSGSPTAQSSGIGGLSLTWILIFAVGLLIVWKVAA